MVSATERIKTIKGEDKIKIVRIASSGCHMQGGCLGQLSLCSKVPETGSLPPHMLLSQVWELQSWCLVLVCFPHVGGREQALLGFLQGRQSCS
jgi:hypothetical protein